MNSRSSCVVGEQKLRLELSVDFDIQNRFWRGAIRLYL